jgi:hypothetical protein
MKSTALIIIAFLFIGSSMFAQVAINNDSTPPDNSAMLDVKSNSRGFLPPRLSFTERNSITEAVAGLIVWCTDCTTTGELQVFNGTIWTNTIGGGASVPFTIGMAYGGGVIFYLDNTGVHGLIAANYDHTAWAQWGCYLNSIPGTSSEIGTGQTNTALIVAECGEPNRAARICDDLVLNGFDDWFLPSKDELNQLYLQKNVVGGFISNFYWSSTEHATGTAWGQAFLNGYQHSYEKDITGSVRAVRAF